jgi:phage gpG-like protein
MTLRTHFPSRFGQIAKAKRLAERALPAIRVEVSHTIEGLVAEGFAQERSPARERWAPRVPPTGTWPILDLSGRGKKAFRVRVTGKSIEIENTTPYMGYHQTGTRNMVARKMLPDRALPPQWRAAIDRTARRVLKGFAE